MPKHPIKTDRVRLAGISRATISYMGANRVDRLISISEQTHYNALEVAAKSGCALSAPSRTALNPAPITRFRALSFSLTGTVPGGR